MCVRHNSEVGVVGNDNDLTPLFRELDPDSAPWVPLRNFEPRWENDDHYRKMRNQAAFHGNGSVSELQGNEASYTATVTPTASGAVTVDIAAGAAEDSAGNPSAAADQFSITADRTPVDTTAPTVTITSAASEPVSGPFSITVTFSEPVTGFELPDLVVGNGSASELQGNEASYTATVTPTASGAVTVDIAAGAAEDSAGNPSAAADQFSITADRTPVDTTAPTVTITSAASKPVSGPFSITVTFSEPVTGFELPDLVVGNGSASELQGNEASYTATVTPTASGAVTVDIAAGAAEDSAGNPSAAADQFSITADPTPVPALPLAGAVALAALLLIDGIRRRSARSQRRAASSGRRPSSQASSRLHHRGPESPLQTRRPPPRGSGPAAAQVIGRRGRRPRPPRSTDAGEGSTACPSRSLPG